jgi:hypothetical protein
VVGGTTSSARNVVSGNGGAGIFINGLRNQVQGNYVGVDAGGTQPLGNDSHGLEIVNADNVIGGTTAGSRNVISANGGDGIRIGPFDDNPSDNRIEGNRIGTKADGTGDLGNAGTGVNIHGPNNVVGGDVAAAGNLIAGNAQNGVRVASGFAHGNQILRNAIVGNDLQGIRMEFGDPTDAIARIAGNAILQNGEHGVRVSATAFVEITANQIFGNGLLGINLSDGTASGGGVTPNDTDDPDAGANDLQNFPVFTSAIRNGTTGVTSINGSLNSTPNTQFRIEFFLAVPDTSGHGEAQVILGSQLATTNAGGDVGFAFFTSGLVPGQVVTATATDVARGVTSEFALNITVVPPPP